MGLLLVDIFRYFQRLFQGRQLVVHFLKLAFFLRIGHNSGSCLIEKRISLAQERPDHNGMVQRVVEAQITDAPAIERNICLIQRVDVVPSEMVTQFIRAASEVNPQSINKTVAMQKH